MRNVAPPIAREGQAPFAQHGAFLAAVLLVVALVYAPVTLAPFCGYDDFHELARTAFELAPAPGRVATTAHDGFKYRPLNRAVTLATWWIAGFSAPAYRVRNLAMHLVSVGAIFALGVLLGGSRAVGASAALLFGLHPLANQSINGAVWTNTMAHAAGLISTVLSLWALIGNRERIPLLVVAVLVAIGGVLLYESTIVVFLLPWLFLLILRAPTRPRSTRLLLALQIGILGSYCALRLVEVPETYVFAGSAISRPWEVARSLVVHVGGLLNPIDPVLAHVAFGTALPPKIDLQEILAVGRWKTFVSLGAVATCGVLVLMVRARRRSKTHEPSLTCHARSERYRLPLVIGAATLLPLTPVLALSSHASETYLYLPAAFYMILCCALAWSWLRDSHHLTYGGLVLVVAAYFAVATTARNTVVMRCGQTAARILGSVPPETANADLVVFANVPGEEPTSRYGLYGYRGIDTLGNGAMAERGVSAAMQLLHADRRRLARVVTTEELEATCAGPHPGTVAIWVHDDGRLEVCADR